MRQGTGSRCCQWQRDLKPGRDAAHTDEEESVAKLSKLKDVPVRMKAEAAEPQFSNASVFKAGH